MKAPQLPSVRQPGSLTVQPSEPELYTEALLLLQELKAMLRELRQTSGGEA